MPASIDHIESALRGVLDPELGVDIVELGMVRGIEVTGPPSPSKSPSRLRPARSGIRSKATSHAK